LDAAEKMNGKVEKEARMSEPEGRVAALPTLPLIFLGTPEGSSGLAVAFLCLLSLARQRK
jgi:hypothetical protein